MASSSSKGLPRRRLTEFAVLHEREPELVDFFVEGRSDRVFLQHVTSEAGSSVRVWEADDIEMPSEEVSNVGEDVGARGRVVAISRHLDQLLPEGVAHHVLCIIDADFDRLLEQSPSEGRFLALTDFSCLESYYWHARSVAKYLRLFLHDSTPYTAEQLLDRTATILRETFLLRAAARSLGLGFSWLDPTSCCGDPRKGGDFNRGEYIQRLLNKNEAHQVRESLEEKVCELRQKLNADIRHSIHGHDLTKVIAWIVKPHLRERALYDEEVISRSLASCVERPEVIGFQLFSRVMEMAAIADPTLPASHF